MIESRYLYFKNFLRLQNLWVVAVILPTAFLIWCIFFANDAGAQTKVLAVTSTFFRIGEKLSYSISFGKIPDAGSAETYVVSRGKISGKDAVELRAKVKTQDLVSAAFFLFDESRSVFAAPDTGLPHYITSSSNDSAFPKETISNYLARPTSNFDLLTLIYKVRESGGVGTFPLFEGETLYTASFQGAAAEKVKTEAGEFDTTVSVGQSDFFTTHGIKEFKINFSADEFRVPVLIRFKTAKGDFKVMLTAITLPEPEAPSPTPTPTPTPGGSPKPTPKPGPTPTQYVDNQPLMPELGFEIGEVLNYRIVVAGKPVGVLTLNARERKLFEKVDSLRLTASITEVEPGASVLRLGDEAQAQVDPETLTPTRIESKFDSKLVGLNQTLTFDKRTGLVVFAPKQSIDAPIGTHSFLSLIYAMRSFNLKPSKDLTSPVNDTRVAVFWGARSYVFTLRPKNPEEITVNGEKVSAQLINISTGSVSPELDALSLKVWLDTETRIPLRFSAGAYQAELISQTSNLSK